MKKKNDQKILKCKINIKICSRFFCPNLRGGGAGSAGWDKITIFSVFLDPPLTTESGTVWSCPLVFSFTSEGKLSQMKVLKCRRARADKRFYCMWAIFLEISVPPTTQAATHLLTREKKQKPAFSLSAGRLAGCVGNLNKAFQFLRFFNQYLLNKIKMFSYIVTQFCFWCYIIYFWISWER